MRGLLLLAGLTVAFAGATLYWLTSTRSGLSFVLASAVEQSDGRLRVADFEGSLRDGFVLRSVRIDDPAMQIELGDVQARIGLAALFGRQVDLQSLRVQQVRMTVAESGGAPAEEDWSVKLHVPDWVLPELQLPVAFSLGDIETGPWRFGELLLADRIRMRADVARSGVIRADSLEIERGSDRIRLVGTAPGVDGLQASWLDDGKPVAEGRLRATSAEARVTVELADGGRFEAVLDRRGRWTLHAEADAALAARFDIEVPPGASLRLDLQGQDDLVRMDAAFSAQDWPSLHAEGELRPVREGVRLDQVVISDDAGGRVSLDGLWAPDADSSLRMQAERARLWPAGTAVEWLTGEGRLQGDADALHLTWQGRLGAQQVEPGFDLDATWDAQRLVVERLLLHLGETTLDCGVEVSACSEAEPPELALEGELTLAEPMRLVAEVRSEGFDPGWLLADLRGRLSGGAHVEAVQHDDDWDLRVDQLNVDGELNGAPMSARGGLVLTAAEPPAGDLQLRYGEGAARVTGRDGGIDLDLKRFDLHGLVPGLTATVDGALHGVWPWSTLAIHGDVHVGAVTWQAWRVRELHVQGGLSSDHGPLRLVAEGVASDSVEGSARLEAELAGHPDALQGRLMLEHELVSMASTFTASLDGAVQKASVSALRIEHARLDAFTLQQPLHWSATDRGWTLEPACLSDGHASVCVQREAVDAPLLARVEEVELARLSRLLDVASPVRVRGVLRADLDARPTATGWSLHRAELHLGQGGVEAIDEGDVVSVLDWEHLSASILPEDEFLRMRVDGQLVEAGSVRADLRLTELSQGGLERAVGDVELDVPQVAWLGVLTPDLVGAEGRLRADLHRADADEATWRGSVHLDDLRGSIPALGLILAESSIEARRDDGRWLLEGLIDSGQGPLRIEGLWPDQGQPTARVVGQSVRLSDTRTLRLIASPDLKLSYAEGRVSVAGTVQVPEARLDLERLEAGETVSSDVVVLDPVEQAERPGPPVSAEVDLVLGESVSLRGFGFDGGIQGKLRIRERPGRSAEGRGTLDVRGQYRAYGQDLQIVRGRLLFAGGALDNPGIDLRAVRKLREVEVGIDVQGQARAPELRVWSNPALDEAEAVSYLVLGQPLRSAGGGDGERLGQAAAALGGNLLAAQLGGRLGVDSIGVSDSAALGGSAFTIGKYLSPSLFLSYGIGLFESGHVVTLRYLLSERADIEVESARESRVGVNYRWETE
ncbi:MAG: translocation/assembly module TamB domain-containing protein [Xanthomonadales bacterium]|nr:translocation/assembly module TamB domain-containing protein [Xanthomonadales bacterium]